MKFRRKNGFMDCRIQFDDPKNDSRLRNCAATSNAEPSNGAIRE